MQRFEFRTAEFLGCSGPERVKKYHEFAADAQKHAAEAINAEKSEAYLDLRREWQALADEIAKFENSAKGDR